MQQDVEPDIMLLPENEIWSEVESAAGLGMPVGFYAIMDSALRYEQGLTPDMHRDQMAQMYQRFSEVAAQNPAAWVHEPVAAETIRGPAPGNRMLAFQVAQQPVECRSGRGTDFLQRRRGGRTGHCPRSVDISQGVCRV